MCVHILKFTCTCFYIYAQDMHIHMHVLIYICTYAQQSKIVSLLRVKDSKPQFGLSLVQRVGIRREIFQVVLYRKQKMSKPEGECISEM